MHINWLQKVAPVVVIVEKWLWPAVPLVVVRTSSFILSVLFLPKMHPSTLNCDTSNQNPDTISQWWSFDKHIPNTDTEERPSTPAVRALLCHSKCHWFMNLKGSPRLTWYWRLKCDRWANESETASVKNSFAASCLLCAGGPARLGFILSLSLSFVWPLPVCTLALVSVQANCCK